MKNLFLLAFIFSVAWSSFAQCPSNELSKKLVGELTKGGKRKYLKTFKVDGAKYTEGNPIKYSYIFSKNKMYYMSVGDEPGTNDKIKVTLYDRAKHLIATNYDERTGKIYPVMVYRCKMTGVLYFHFEFVGDAKDGCGLGVLGFGPI